MSIYSGFASRSQEQAYDQCIDSLLYVMQKRLIKFYQNEPTEEHKFISILIKLHAQMKNMESTKYLEPKTSVALAELVKYLQAHHQAILTQSVSSHQINPNASQLPAIQPQLPLQEPRSEKKNAFWVEKSPRNIDTLEQEVQTMGTIYLKREPKEDSIEKPQPRRTVYGPLSGLRPKESSRNTFSRAKGEPKLFKLNKNRSASNNLPDDKANTSSKASALAVENHLPRKKKGRVSSKMGNTQLEEEEEENQVADIIKEYMARTKKSYWADQKEREKGKEGQ